MGIGRLKEGQAEMSVYALHWRLRSCYCAFADLVVTTNASTLVMDTLDQQRNVPHCALTMAKEDHRHSDSVTYALTPYLW